MYLKKIFLMLSALSIMVSPAVNAHGYYNNNNAWVTPLVVGGAIGYILAQPRVIVQQPIIVQPVQIYQVPQYQYQYVYDPACSCTKQILIQMY